MVKNHKKRHPFRIECICDYGIDGCCCCCFCSFQMNWNSYPALSLRLSEAPTKWTRRIFERVVKHAPYIHTSKYDEHHSQSTKYIQTIVSVCTNICAIACMSIFIIASFWCVCALHFVPLLQHRSIPVDQVSFLHLFCMHTCARL